MHGVTIFWKTSLGGQRWSSHSHQYIVYVQPLASLNPIPNLLLSLPSIENGSLEHFLLSIHLHLNCLFHYFFVEEKDAQT